MKERRKIGILGGTFDPIHCGHLNIAFELMEKRKLDQVWFVPAKLNPFKVERPPTLLEHRLNMVRLALQDIPQFFLKELESERPSPSYTIHTLRDLVAQEAHNPTPDQFYLLLGEDSIPGFVHWHLPEEIVKIVPLLIASRSGFKQNSLEGFSLAIREAIEAGLTETALMDVSGSWIRERLSQNLYCGHFLSPLVLDYIRANRLY